MDSVQILAPHTWIKWLIQPPSVPSRASLASSGLCLLFRSVSLLQQLSKLLILLQLSYDAVQVVRILVFIF